MCTDGIVVHIHPQTFEVERGTVPGHMTRLDLSAMPNAVYDLSTKITESVVRKTQLLVLISVIGSAWLLSSYATASPTSAAAETPRITILYDAFGKDAAMTGDPGGA